MRLSWFSCGSSILVKMEFRICGEKKNSRGNSKLAGGGGYSK